MEKITIKINYAALKELYYLFEIQTFAETNAPPDIKAVMSILQELSKQFEKKEIDKRRTANKFKMTFKYYEGFALERFCRSVYCGFSENNYTAHVALDIANQIHKQL